MVFLKEQVHRRQNLCSAGISFVKCATFLFSFICFLDLHTIWFLLFFYHNCVSIVWPKTSGQIKRSSCVINFPFWISSLFYGGPNRISSENTYCPPPLDSASKKRSISKGREFLLWMEIVSTYHYHILNFYTWAISLSS